MSSNFNVSRLDQVVLQNLPGGSPTATSVVIENTFEAAEIVRRRKPPGWIPPTHYFLSSIHRRGSQGIYGTINTVTNAGFKYTGAVVGASGSPWSVDAVTNPSQTVDVAGEKATLINEALIECRSNLKDMKVDLGTAFGERNQTARLIGDTASRLARAVRNLRRGQIRNAMRDLGILNKKGTPRGSNWTKNWLELQYGWKPLLSDVFGACDALSKRGKDDWMVTAKGNASRKPFGSYVNADMEASWRTGVSRYELGVLIRADACPSTAFSSLSSVGVLNPLNVAWELVPYSFVVDWFLPIGGWISSLDATVGFEFRGVSQTYFELIDSQASGQTHKSEVSKNLFINEWNATKRQVTVDRTVLSSLPRAGFPSFKNPVSLGHMANGLSLLAQAFGRR
jgi:hypothetical protein